ncbi:MAG TPA: hypothetical protein VH877_00050 [Polyangia bacterium]|nr:hypothetical protein [Polyangia bacterium]
MNGISWIVCATLLLYGAVAHAEDLLGPPIVAPTASVRNLSFEYTFGLPFAVRSLTKPDVYYPNRFAALDFNVGINYLLNPRVSVGVQIGPGVVFQGPEGEMRRRLSFTPNLQVYAYRHHLFLRTGFYIPLFPEATFGVQPGTGVSFGKKVRVLLELSTPVVFVGAHPEVEVTFDVGIEIGVDEFLRRPRTL